MFRYADALLMMAECYFYKDNYEKAVEYLDMTRTRAGLANYTYRTPARLEEEIRNERAREHLRRVPAQVRSGSLGHLVRSGDG